MNYDKLNVYEPFINGKFMSDEGWGKTFQPDNESQLTTPYNLSLLGASTNCLNSDHQQFHKYKKKTNNHHSTQGMGKKNKKNPPKTIMIYGFGNSDPVLGKAQQNSTWYYPHKYHPITYHTYMFLINTGQVENYFILQTTQMRHEELYFTQIFTNLYFTFAVYNI